jgi:aminomuconate-semialdehyde/2-hydroxymuconate-6-semialdehyde dehydrogenase
MQNALSHPEWHHTMVTARKRSDWLRKIADAIEARLDEFAAAESLDTGKPTAFARTVDIPRSIENFRYFSDFARHFPSECHPSEAGGFNYTSRKPVGTMTCSLLGACFHDNVTAGVVGLITPWNLPLYLLTWKVAPALMMGNTIVCKPRLQEHMFWRYVYNFADLCLQRDDSNHRHSIGRCHCQRRNSCRSIQCCPWCWT